MKTTKFSCPKDPNEIYGPDGYGDSRFVSSLRPLDYIVYFENDPEVATAAANKVVITHPFDPKMNMQSLKLGGFGFFNMDFSVPPNSSYYSTRIDMRDSMGVYVDVTAGLNVGNNTAFWIFQAIDPATGLPPEDPDMGFLPVNDTNTHRGEGYVKFSVRPKSSAVTGDSLRASASIVFDINAPMETNTWLNIADDAPPVTTVNGLPPSADTSSVSIYFSGSDDAGGSGIQYVSLYVSENGGPFNKYGDTEIDSFIVFTGNACTTYRFFSLGTDHTGNTENMKNAGETSITLVPAPVFDIQPESVSKYIGEDASFTVSAQPVKFYQWEVSTDAGSTFEIIPEAYPYSGTQTATLTITDVDTSVYGNIYICMASNGSCYTYSDTAILLLKSFLTGQVTYENILNSPMNNTEVYLRDSEGLKSDSVITNQAGYYLFPSLNQGEYIIGTEIDKAWGGVNATDALLVLKHFANLDTLTGLKLLASDVNASATVNAIDALLIVRRFVGLISSFVTGDWVHPEDSVEIGNEMVVRDMKAVCYGDADGSFVPGMRKSPSVRLVVSGTRRISEGESFSIPFISNSDMVIGALSMIIRYPSEFFELEGVEMKIDRATNELLYQDFSGTIRLGWYSLDELSVSQGEPLLILKLRAKERELFDKLEFQLDAECEVAEYTGIPYNDVMLTMPRLTSAAQVSDFSLRQNYPNPFRSHTQFSYFLPEAGNVTLNIYNSIGQKITGIINEYQEKGYHLVDFDGDGLAADAYVYRLELRTEDSFYTAHKFMTKL